MLLFIQNKNCLGGGMDECSQLSYEWFTLKLPHVHVRITIYWKIIKVSKVFITDIHCRVNQRANDKLWWIVRIIVILKKQYQQKHRHLETVGRGVMTVEFLPEFCPSGQSCPVLSLSGHHSNQASKPNEEVLVMRCFRFYWYVTLSLRLKWQSMESCLIWKKLTKKHV